MRTTLDTTTTCSRTLLVFTLASRLASSHSTIAFHLCRATLFRMKLAITQPLFKPLRCQSDTILLRLPTGLTPMQMGHPICTLLLRRRE